MSAAIAFHQAYYNSALQTWGRSKWMGLPIMQLPFDLMSYQELIWTSQPKLIVQTGVGEGGSLLFFAHMLDILGYPAKVIGIDTVAPQRPERLAHPRIQFIHAQSTDMRTVDVVRQAIAECGGHVMVCLDSDHSKAHVAAELAAYAPLMPFGSWLVVEDTNINGHPVAPTFGPGPREALADFMAANGSLFDADNDFASRHLFSFHSWLRRRAA